jgi:hypothetical protein
MQFCASQATKIPGAQWQLSRCGDTLEIYEEVVQELFQFTRHVIYLPIHLPAPGQADSEADESEDDDEEGDDGVPKSRLYSSESDGPECSNSG